MCRFLLSIVMCVTLTGCATDPFSQMETTTPVLTPSQIAELQKRAKSPGDLGILMRPGAQSVEFGGKFRVPVVLATVNGKDGVQVLLDSGSNQNLFGYSLSRSLNIPTIAG